MNIDIDFDVFKALTIKRRNEAMTYNDVLRELLDLPIRPDSPAQKRSDGVGDWVVSGVRFPEGTEFRGTLKGNPVRAVVREGTLHLNGTPYNSPSMAVMSLTGYAVNGWRFWECLFPGTSTWRKIDDLRSAAA